MKKRLTTSFIIKIELFYLLQLKLPRHFSQTILLLSLCVQSVEKEDEINIQSKV